MAQNANQLLTIAKATDQRRQRNWLQPTARLPNVASALTASVIVP